MQIINAPTDQHELLERVQALAGLTVAQSAAKYGLPVPNDLRQHKGWFGALMEVALGADANSKPMPDFVSLGIELKTLPVGANGKPSESTFVASISLTEIAKERWETSIVRKKLSHVLWLPIEGDPAIALAHRRIGLGFLWRFNATEEALLKRDWCELTELIMTGKLDTLSAHMGEVLQIRPKAADGRALTAASDSEGATIRTLPRGFYLRARFTESLLRKHHY